ncbi:hypothetical protein QQZ08_006453 [Neonectria magnoliae]|uniref:Cyclase n=1 Tax=Neonectria magnoliae TaxID=2732573 RepID=A0ABR1I120_9HYPO
MAAFDLNSAPDFDDLPKVEGMPQDCAWGVFDGDGEKDIVGTLNFLTPEVVKAAAGKHQPIGLAYNGAEASMEALSVESTASNPMPTLDHWHARGCIVGRGVLIDFKAFAEENRITFHPFGSDRISVEDIEACAAHFGVELRPGDILLVRTSATEVVDKMDPVDLDKMGAGTLSGLHGSEQTASFEAFPSLKPDNSIGGMKDLDTRTQVETEAAREQGIMLHTYLLNRFGMSIGELCDLSKLSAYCKKAKWYSFMITSSPLNQPDLIGSPPNAVAIF